MAVRPRVDPLCARACIRCAPDSTEQLTQGLPHAAAPAQTGKPYRLPKGEKTTPHENENRNGSSQHQSRKLEDTGMRSSKFRGKMTSKLELHILLNCRLEKHTHTQKNPVVFLSLKQIKSSHF